MSLSVDEAGVRPARMASKWYEALGSLADRPDDDDDEKLKHRFLIITGITMSFGGLVWGTLSFILGVSTPGLIPYGYTAITIVNFIVLHRRKNFATARTIQILISLLLPFLFQWSLGGFVTSGCMMVWSILSLIAAQSFEERDVLGRAPIARRPGSALTEEPRLCASHAVDSRGNRLRAFTPVSVHERKVSEEIDTLEHTLNVGPVVEFQAPAGLTLATEIEAP